MSDQPVTIAVPEELLWRSELYLRMLCGMLLSGEVRAEVEAFRAKVFQIVTEVRT